MPPSTFWTPGVLLALAAIGCSSEPAYAPPPGLIDQEAIEHELARPVLAGTEVSKPDTSAPGSDSAGAAGAPNAGGESSCAPHATVLTSHVTNARDLGGTPLANGEAVACGAIYRGPPLRLAEPGCAEAARLGLRTLIDLRIEGERTSVPDSDCVAATRVFAPLPVPYGLGPTDYLRDLNETASIAIAFHAFGDPDAYPIYFHCTFGRDRTGVVGALLLLALGATREAVVEEYLLSRPNVGAYPDSLAAVLDDIEQRGGAEAVLKGIGISDGELAVMRSHAVAIE